MVIPCTQISQRYCKNALGERPRFSHGLFNSRLAIQWYSTSKSLSLSSFFSTFFSFHTVFVFVLPASDFESLNRISLKIQSFTNSMHRQTGNGSYITLHFLLSFCSIFLFNFMEDSSDYFSRKFMKFSFLLETSSVWMKSLNLRLIILFDWPILLRLKKN